MLRRVWLLPVAPKLHGTLTLWNGSGRARSFLVEIDEMLRTKVHLGIQTASRTKQERLTSSSTSRILNDLSLRGITFEEKTPSYDEDDAVGLIGEILLTEIVTSLGCETVFVKWQVTGTAKSRGIDLVSSRNNNGLRDLVLMEAKHLHSAVKGRERGTCSSIIRTRFADGLDEFKHERTLVNLASIIIGISRARRVARGMNGDRARLDEVFNLLLSGLSLENYELEVFVFIDAKCCVDETLAESVAGIGTPIEVGDHRASLTLLQTEHLKSVSEEICEHYA